MKLSILFFGLFFGFKVAAMAITQKNSALSLRVDRNDNETFSFYLCDETQVPNCQQLGKYDQYTAENLEIQMTRLRMSYPQSLSFYIGNAVSLSFIFGKKIASPSQIHQMIISLNQVQQAQNLRVKNISQYAKLLELALDY